MSRPQARRAICLVLAVLLSGATSAAAAVGPATAPATAAGDPRPGTSEEFRDGLNSYRVYTPNGYRSGQKLPLYVMLHGCNSTSANQDGNGINAVADREHFVVLYPSHDQYENTDPGTHPLRCWRWFSPADMHRGAGDPATVARQTELVAAKWGTDRTRSYLVGMSSGAMMTSLVAASYPTSTPPSESWPAARTEGVRRASPRTTTKLIPPAPRRKPPTWSRGHGPG
jgi:poly(3-hydroxybutyrate) depolymerase